MIAAKNLTEQINNIVEELPYKKQQEVYDFVSFLKSKDAAPVCKDKKSSLNDLVGILEGPSDLAEKHDELYDA